MSRHPFWILCAMCKLSVPFVVLLSYFTRVWLWFEDVPETMMKVLLWFGNELVHWENVTARKRRGNRQDGSLCMYRSWKPGPCRSWRRSSNFTHTGTYIYCIVDRHRHSKSLRTCAGFKMSLFFRFLFCFSKTRPQWGFFFFFPCFAFP